MAQSKILDSNINTRSQVGRQVINEKNAKSFMKKYELFDRVDLFPKEIRTMEIKDWESFARRNPYLAKFLNKKLPGYFFLALETWNSADDSASSSPLVETIFADTIIYLRNLILDNDEKMSAEASILLKNIGLALASVPGDDK